MTDFLRQLRLMTTIMRSRGVLNDDPEVGHFPTFHRPITTDRRRY